MTLKEVFSRFSAFQWFIGFVAGMLVMVAMFAVYGSGNACSDYYAPAEWLFTTESSSYFAVENGSIYAVDADPSYNGDHPYLLHMDSNNTTDPTDDIVLVVWSTK